MTEGTSTGVASSSPSRIGAPRAGIGSAGGSWRSGVSPRSQWPALAGRGRLVLSLAALFTGILLGASGVSSAAAGPVFTTAPPAVGASRSLSWSGTVPAGSTAECALTDPAGLATSVACVAGAGFSYAAAVPSDGSWALTVWAVTAGAAGPVRGLPVTSTTTVDTVPPGVQITAAPISPSSNRSPTWTIAVEPGATATCRLSGPASVGPSPCSGPWTADLASAPEGSYVLQATAVDVAGNRAVASSGIWVLDVPPGQPVVSGPASPGSARSVNWSFPMPAGASAACSLTGPLGPVVSAVACSSPWPTTLTGGDGSYTATVILTDGGGSSPAGTAAYLLDTTPPAAPVVSGPSGRTANPVVTWSFDPAGQSAECAVRLGGLPQGSAPCSSPYTRRATADGVYSLEVTLVDAAGNRSAPGSSPAVTVDTTPPPTPTFATVPASPARGPSFTWNVTSADALTCRVEGAVLVQDWAPCTTSVTVNLTGRPDGSYLLLVRAADDLGNTSPPATGSVVFDTTPPSAPVVSLPTSPASARTWTATVATEPGAVLTCRLTTPSGAPAAVQVCGPTVTVDLSGMPDGRYVLAVTATDAAGNASAPAVSSYLLDTTPPAVPVLTGAAGPSSGRAWPVAVTTDAAATTTCTLADASGRPLATAACSGNLTIDLSGRADGGYTLTATSTDAAGNAASSAPITYLLDTTPPAAPVLTASPGPSAAPWWTVTWSAESGTTGTCTLTRAGASIRTSPCASAHQVDLSGLPDGTYTITITLADAAGNISPASSADHVLDTTPPAAPVLSAPGGPSSNPSWTVTWTGEPAATATCRLVRGVLPGGVVLTADSRCTSPALFDLASRPDDTYSVEVNLTDAAGNRSGTSRVSYQLDRTPPGAPVLLVPGSPASDPVPTWTINAESGAILTCTLTAPGGAVRTVPLCPSLFAPDLSSADGIWTLAVTAVDAAGNQSPGATATYLLDRVAPPVPILTAPPSPSNSRSPTWTVSAESGARLTCRVVGPAAQLVLDGPCGLTVSVNLTGWPDGPYTLSVSATDAAGNTSAVGASTVLLDTTAPAAPVIQTGPTSPSPVRTPSWTISGDAGATLSCRLDGPAGPVTAWTACAGTFAGGLSAAPDGTYTFSVRATDAASNVSATTNSTYLLDTTAPPAVAVVAPRTPGSSRAPVWTFSAEAGATILCRLGDFGAFLPCTTGSSLQLDLSRAADGSYTAWVQAVDAAGNTGPATLLTYQLDTSPPAAPVFTLEPGTSSARSVTWRFTTEPGVTTTCTLGGPMGEVVASGGCAGSFIADLTGRPDGAYTLRVWSADAALNVSPTVSSAYLLDTVPPAAPVVVPPTTPSPRRAPVWAFSNEGAAQCQLRTGSTVLVSWAGCSGSFTADLSARPDGSYALDVRTTDAAGNVSATTTTEYVLDTTAPAAPAITAPASPAAGRRPVFGVTLAEPGGTAECRLLRDGGVELNWSACTGGQLTLDLAGRADGAYRLEVRQTDLAGNVGPISAAEYLLDTTPPAAVAVVAPASPGAGRTPTWSLATEPGGRIECRLGGAATFGPCTGPTTASLDLLLMPDGSYVLDVRAVDRAGNVGPVTRLVYVLDTQPPAAAVVTAAPGPSPVTAPAWTWTGEPGATAACTLSRDGLPVLSSACVSGWRPALVGDGSWQLTVVLRDAAGNASSPSSATYVLDTTPPGAPAVLGPSSPNAIADPIFTLSVESGARTQCRLWRSGAASPLFGWRDCPSPVQLSLPGPGSFVLQVRAVDLAANISTLTSYAYTYDPDAPAGLADVVVPTPSRSSDTRPSWSFTAPDGASTTCRWTTPDGTASTAACTGGFTPRPLTEDGSYRLDVLVVDAVGNRASFTSGYVLDTTGPPAPVVTPDGLVSRDPAVTWTWSVSRDTTDTVCRLLRGGSVVLDWTPCTPRTFDLSPYGEGVFTLEVYGRDDLRNRGLVGQGRYAWDQTAPAVPAASSSAGSSGSARTVVWTWPTPADVVRSSCAVRRSAATILGPVACTGTFGLDLTGQPDGLYELVFLLTDAAGNTSTGRATYALTAVRPAPVVAPAPGLRPEPPVDRTASPRVGYLPAPARPVTAPPADLAPPAASDRQAARRNLVLPAPAAAVAQAVAQLPAGPALGLPNGALSGARAVEVLKDVAGETIRRPQVPIVLLVVVGLFLLVQNRIDRRDPKLAAAEQSDDPDLLFRPLRPGGATT